MKSKVSQALRALFFLFVIAFVYNTLYRVLFLMVNASTFQPENFLNCLWIGFKFDLGILIGTIVLVYLVQRIFRHIYFTLCILGLILLIQYSVSTIDIILYRDWDSNFSIRAIRYLDRPLEILGSLSIGTILFFLSGLVVLLVLYALVIRRLDLIRGMDNIPKGICFDLIIILILIGLSFLTIRGGFRSIPRNQSDAYFCRDKTYNIAALNSLWNMADVIFQSKRAPDFSLYQKMSKDQADSLCYQIFSPGVPMNTALFRIDSGIKPNVIFITMEGVSWHLSESNSGNPIMPFLHSLKSKSYSFENAYAIGFRTEQGLAAFLSGALTTPFINLTDNLADQNTFPSILNSFYKRNYSTHFLFGGDVEFGKMKSYLAEIGFKDIQDINKFSILHREQKLGAPDEYLFEKALDHISKLKSPFFYQLMTLSTHTPFDIPHRNIPLHADRAYELSAAYLDSCLKVFMEGLERLPSFQNSIIVITSDHSHKYPSEIDIATKSRFKIPFILYSPLLKKEFVGKMDTVLFPQSDFPATLSYLLDWRENNFLPYSRNHFSNAKKFVFSAFVNGYLFQMDTFCIQYDYVWRPITTQDSLEIRLHKFPQAIMQSLHSRILHGNMSQNSMLPNH